MGDDEAQEASPAKVSTYSELRTGNCSLVGPAGIEPATLGLEIQCSIRLSYGPTRALYLVDQGLGTQNRKLLSGLSIA
jgi:hypothetical protein